MRDSKGGNLDILLRPPMNVPIAASSLITVFSIRAPGEGKVNRWEVERSRETHVLYGANVLLNWR